MGNKPTPYLPEMLKKDYEYQTGQRLIRAIKANSRSQLQDAVDCARNEIQLHSKNVKIAHDKDYEDMVKKMIAYLTRGYDVGDGVLFTKTPLEIAEIYHCSDAAAFINENLELLSRSQVSSHVVAKQGLSVAPKSSVGAVDKDRVHQAKERLKAFQAERKT